MLNTITVIINQIVVVICGFIVPRMILLTYGSEVNGLVSSITQFLTVITFMDMGIGVVVQASLYKPLANGDHVEVSKIISSADRFLKKIALGILIYVIILVFAYPRIVNQSFGDIYTGTLILAMCISYFAQYFFGLKNQLLVIADQKGYIAYALNSLLLIANNAVSVILILHGASIQFVKLVASLILVAKPFILEAYVRKNYRIDRKVKYTEEPIKQKWNGIAQHIATVILTSTDTIVLSLLSTLENVSIYYVYHLVVNGLDNLVIAFTSGFLSLFGNMISKNEDDLLKKSFNAFESMFHLIVTYIFGCVLVLIVPFVQVYTKGVTDVNYALPTFAALITIANLFYCYRLPYNTLVKAAGHFRQTQNSAIIEAALNIIISVILVFKYGLVGVAIGTLVAMAYKTVYLVLYLRHNIIKRGVMTFVKHMIADAICLGAIYILGSSIVFTDLTYMSWIVLAIKWAVINLAICCLINVIFFRNDIISGYRYLRRKTH